MYTKPLGVRVVSGQVDWKPHLSAYALTGFSFFTGFWPHRSSRGAGSVRNSLRDKPSRRFAFIFLSPLKRKDGSQHLKC